MSEATDTLLSLLLPEGILDYFELTKVDKNAHGLNIYLEEKNIAPAGNQKSELESKVFFSGGGYTGFPHPGTESRLVCETPQMDSGCYWLNYQQGLGFSNKRDANDNRIRSFFKRYIWIIIPLAVIIWANIFRLMVNFLRNSIKNILVNIVVGTNRLMPVTGCFFQRI